jgi:hypothetical protein
MTTYTWTADTSGLWTTAANWTPMLEPGAGDTALVTLPGAYLISEPTTAAVATLILDDASAEISVGGTLSVTSGMTVTAGSVAVGGTLTVANLDNAGAITNSGELTVTNLQNTGTITNNGGHSLNVGGTTDGQSLSRIGGADGDFSSTALVNNAGGTLNGTTLSEQNISSLGTIDGGSVANLTSPGVTQLDGVTWLGPLDLTGGTIVVEDGLTLTGANGTGPGTLSLGGEFEAFEFIGDESIDNAEMSGIGTLIATDTLTIGSGFSFYQVAHAIVAEGGQAVTFAGAGTILSHGTFVSISTNNGAPFYYGSAQLGFQIANFENFGLLDVRDISVPNSGSRVLSEADIYSGTFINEAGGTFEAGQSAGVAQITIEASANFTNNGIMLTQDPVSAGGGTIDIAAILDGSGTIEVNGGGLVHLSSATSNTQNIDFVGAGTLSMDTPSFDPAIINGFGTSDFIDLGVAATGVSYTSGDLKLQVTGGQTIDLDVTGDYTLSNFSIVASANSTVIQVACFATGTRLATARGLVSVETLREGDEMLLARGNTSRTVEWIGHRTVDCANHPNPEQVWPVCVSAGAFAPNVPLCDLLLSPDHAVFVSGILIPVKYLINHRTITQRKVRRIEYWHVELPHHDVMLAEGLCVESLLPGSGRAFFPNGGGPIALYPDQTARDWEMRGCAPLVITGPELAAVRAMLSSRFMECRRAA